MKRPRLRMLGFIAVLVGTLMSVPSAATGGAETAVRAAAQPNHVRFVLLNTDVNEEGGTVLAFGALHARGEDKVTGEFQDRFEFPDGNLIIRHRPRGTGRDTFDPVTCYGTFTERGTWRINRGTGDYTKAEGEGTYHVRAEFIGCNQKKPPRTFFVKIVALGDLTY